MAQLPRSRLWCGTFFDPNADDPATFRGAIDSGLLTYFVGQCEVCPDTNRKHLQFFFCLRDRRTLIGVKRILFFSDRLRTAHLAACQGTSDQNRTYCSKVESRDPAPAFPPLEIGIFADCPERNGQGARTDLHGIAVRIRDGASLHEIATDHPDTYVKYHRGFTALQQQVRCVPRQWNPGADYTPPTVRWYYGLSGSGKSRAAWTSALSDPLRPCYSKPAGNRWFDGYSGEPIIIFDDYRGDWFSFSYLIRLLDVYPLQVECKGSMVPMSADTFYITCPMRPEQLYQTLVAREDGRIQQLLRRITEIRLFGEEPDPPRPFVEGFNRG